MARTCILICTFDRPALLARLLEALMPQAAAVGAIIVVADNGTRPAQDVVARFQRDTTLIYTRVEERGLVHARNATLRAALPLRPDYLVFIDDDEAPEQNWLTELLGTMERTGAGFATGPVHPEYETQPPAWATRGMFFHASADSLRTSNLIVRAALVPAGEPGWFHPDFNLIGGEDREFLTRLMQAGAIHAVAHNARVSEFVPAERLKRRYILRRGMREGVAAAALLKHRQTGTASYLGRVALRAAQKLGYAVNHLFWSIGQPWRLVSAMADLASIAGLALSACGARPAFYGKPRALETTRDGNSTEG